MNGQQQLSKSQRRRANRRNRQTETMQTSVVIRPVQAPARTQGPNGARHRVSQAYTQSSANRQKTIKRSRRSNNKAQELSLGKQYLRSLLDPEHCAGIKIPDMISFPSGTFQLTVDKLVPTLTGGDSVAIWLCPQIGDGGATASQFIVCNGNSAGALSNQSPQESGGTPTVRQLFSGYRPVSASIVASFIGPSLSDGGIILGALLPRNTQPPASYTAAQALPNNYSCPLRDGMMVLWRPEDNADMEFQGQVPIVSPPSIYVAATGIPSGVSYVKFRLVMNFEAIVSTDVANVVEATPSPIDLIGFTNALQYVNNTQMAMNLRQSLTNAAVGFAGNYLRNRMFSNLDRIAM